MQINSLTSGAVGGSRPVGPPPGPPPGGAGGPEKTLSAVADLLGTDIDSLKDSLDSGKTLSDLAGEAGVSQQELISTIQATLPTQAPDGMSVDTADMASRIANGQGPKGPQGPPPARPETSLQDGVEALSSALGVSEDDLIEALTSEEGITDLLKDKPEVAARLEALQHTGSLVDSYA